MSKIRVLDCTLRDGGYVNNWSFGADNIRKILDNLIKSRVDYVECGFLEQGGFDGNKSLFPTISHLENLLKPPDSGVTFTLMISYGSYRIEDIPDCVNKNINLRVIFKKNEIPDALEYCKALIQKGYDIFINPRHTNTYSSSELLSLVKQVNEIKPKGFTIVDTTGAMKEKDILTAFYVIDSSLNRDIALCFHSHNNLQLSFSNAQCLMKVCTSRELIIDSTVFGIGRGAGNLCTELLTQYLNDNYGGDYNLVPILKIVDEQINPIFAKTPWGYSVPYYLAATNHCHPNYAKYLIDKQTVPVEFINNLLTSIPENKKAAYDSDLIKQLYLDKFSAIIDDSAAVKYLEDVLQKRKILILAPGKSLKCEKEKIEQFIEKENPFIFSLNFVPEDFEENLAFFTNVKRFSALKNYEKPLILSSNIENRPENAFLLNYSSYLNKSNMFDNIALMLLTLLSKIGVREVWTAGFDGFCNDAGENYVSDDLIFSAKIVDRNKQNEIISEELQKLSEKIQINFITKTLYKVSKNCE